MRRTETFTFRVRTDERQLIADLARKLQRSRSDVIRWLIREAARELSFEDNIDKDHYASDTKTLGNTDG